jgi:protein arginine N-methyltransferase 1
MDPTKRLRPILSAQIDRAFDVAVSWAKRTPMGYKLRNRGFFSRLQSHEEMLADKARVDAYAQALPRLVKPTDVVLDLGTGTGVLAFLAARSGARSVHAVEHGPVIEVARRLAEANGLSNIAFHNMHSGSLHLDEPIDILVHEQMGNSLFEERMVTNVVDLRNRVLRPGGAIVPGAFDFFVEPVALKPAYVVPYIWEQNIEGIDFSVLHGTASEQPPEYRWFNLLAFQFDRPLASPAPALHLDLHTISPAELPTVLDIERLIESAGTVHGLGVWFRAFLDHESTIDTTPFDMERSNWRTPVLRLEHPLDVSPGDKVRIRLEAETLESMDTWTWSVQHEKG